MFKHTSNLLKNKFFYTNRFPNSSLTLKPIQLAKIAIVLNINEDTILTANRNQFGNILIKFNPNKITSSILMTQVRLHTELDPDELYFFKENDELGLLIYDNDAKDFAFQLASLNINDTHAHNSPPSASSC